jgi:hypothetical protein
MKVNPSFFQVVHQAGVPKHLHGHAVHDPSHGPTQDPVRGSEMYSKYQMLCRNCASTVETIFYLQLYTSRYILTKGLHDKERNGGTLPI